MKTNTKKLTLAGVLCAVAVVGSMFSFPVFGSKCAPVQHMVNIAFYAYVVPFLVSTIGGSLIAGAVLLTLEKNNALQRMQSSITG